MPNKWLTDVFFLFLALNKQSCREWYNAGHRDSSEYVIDVDRNGPLPPARVKCSLVGHDQIATTIVHNLPHEMVSVRFVFVFSSDSQLCL